LADQGGERTKLGLVSRLQTYRLSHLTIGISRKLVAVNSLIEKPCLHAPGCHPFCHLPGSGRFPTIIGCRLRPCLSAPCPKKRLLPFHLGLPGGSAWSPVPGAHSDAIMLPCNRTSGSNCRLLQRERTSRSRQSRAGVSKPYRAAISAGSG
jgi:hypothetical protein